MSERTQNLSADAIAALSRRIDRPVVLVGLMGAGKSTVGRKLAALLGTSFVDADDAIVQAAQQSIAEIFAEYGEPYFRDGERRVIARLMQERYGVIATGGGAFVNDETRALILSQGIAVWINCPVDILVERTVRKNTRPLLQNGDPHEILSRLHAERMPFYSQAPIEVVSETGPHGDTAMTILGALDQWL